MAEGLVGPPGGLEGEKAEVIRRIGQLDLEPRFDGSPSPLREEFDELYGPGGWVTREVTPATTAERLYQNMGYSVLEVYRK